MLKIALDECVTQKFLRHLEEYEVTHINKLGESVVKNGKLLTVDKNMQYQQNIAQYNICILVCKVYSNTLKELLKLLPRIKTALKDVKSGSIITIDEL